MVIISTVPFSATVVSTSHSTRQTAFIFLLSLMITITNFDVTFDMSDIYHSLFNQSSFSLIIDNLLFLVGALALLGFHTNA